MQIKDLFRENNNQSLDELNTTKLGQNVGKIAKGIGSMRSNIKQAAGNFKQGFQQGLSGQPQTTAPAADAAAQEPAAEPTQPKTVTKKYDAFGPVDNPNPAAVKAAPAAGDNAEIKKQLDSFLATYKKDLDMQNKNWNFVTPKVIELEKQVAALRQQLGTPDPDDNPNIVRSDSSVQRSGKSITENIQLFRK